MLFYCNQKYLDNENFDMDKKGGTLIKVLVTGHMEQ